MSFGFADAVGLGAGAFVILAFYSTNGRALRVFAITSNLLFILYGVMVQLWPIFLLHAILLPLNLLRLSQIDARARFRTHR
ncbi:MAG: hypothetical protein AAFR34_03375 [Pseudomonadota bacterium]